MKTVTMAYIILLGMVLGAGLYAGVVVAPVTFGTEQWLGGEVLSRYQEGLIMTENFVRLAYVVTVTIVVVFLFEGYKYHTFQRENLTLLATFLVIASGSLFSFYYIPDIVAMQVMGEEMTQSEAFVNTHKGSEINFKLFVFAVLGLLIQNLRVKLTK
jgi:hypothetical protein